MPKYDVIVRGHSEEGLVHVDLFDQSGDAIVKDYETFAQDTRDDMIAFLVERVIEPHEKETTVLDEFRIDRDKD